MVVVVVVVGVGVAAEMDGSVHRGVPPTSPPVLHACTYPHAQISAVATCTPPTGYAPPNRPFTRPITPPRFPTPSIYLYLSISLSLCLSISPPLPSSPLPSCYYYCLRYSPLYPRHSSSFHFRRQPQLALPPPTHPIQHAPTIPAFRPPTPLCPVSYYFHLIVVIVAMCKAPASMLSFLS